MNPLSCFIIDDNAAIQVLTKYIHTNPRLKLTGSTEHADNAPGTFLVTGYPDVIFINIDQSKDALGYLNEYISRHRTFVIITSTLKENAYYAFETGVFDFLLKPFVYDRFIKTAMKLLIASPPLKERSSLYIQGETKGKMIKINHDEIKFIEANQNYINIFIDNGKHITHQTMKNIEERLPAHHFIRIHKSFIVNEHKIHSVNNDYVVLKDKTLLKVGPSYRERLLSKLLPVISPLLSGSLFLFL